MRPRRTWLLPVLPVLLLATGARMGGQSSAGARVPEPASFFFEMLGYSETWVSFTPPPAPGEALSPLSLNITVRYRGRPPEGAITAPLLAVLVRAQSNPRYQPNVVRQATFMLYADDEQVWDASQQIDFSPAGAPCEGCALSTDVVQVSIPLDSVKRLGQAREVTGAAFGFRFSLDSAQRDAVAALAARVLSGQRP